MTATHRSPEAEDRRSTASHEPGIGEHVDERPRLELGKALKAKPRDLLIRFIAGSVTSVVAGLLTLAFGARVGGIMLAFPAILGASLTLIEQKEDEVEAREDARGAIVGGCALAIFAAVVALTVEHVSGVIALLIGTAAWLVAAMALYALLWWR
jgi:uncharacterized membrane protein (GlpM family)